QSLTDGCVRIDAANALARCVDPQRAKALAASIRTHPSVSDWLSFSSSALQIGRNGVITTHWRATRNAEASYPNPRGVGRRSRYAVPITRRMPVSGVAWGDHGRWI